MCDNTKQANGYGDFGEGKEGVKKKYINNEPNNRWQKLTRKVNNKKSGEKMKENKTFIMYIIFVKKKCF